RSWKLWQTRPQHSTNLRRDWELHLSNDAVATPLGGTPTEIPDHYRKALRRCVNSPSHTKTHSLHSETVTFLNFSDFLTCKCFDFNTAFYAKTKKSQALRMIPFLTLLLKSVFKVSCSLAVLSLS